MSNPMIEKVARAICAAGRIDPDRKFTSSDWGASTAPHELQWHAYQPEARAAIKAMRDPGPELADAFIGLDAGQSSGDEPERTHEFFGTLRGFQESWNDAIDAAVKDKP